MTLVEFLLARIAEDEGIAQGAIHWSEGVADWGDGGEPDWEHIARWDPTRVLAKCAADRRIVENCDALNYEGHPGAGMIGDRILAALALPYADHPDYRQEWAP